MMDFILYGLCFFFSLCVVVLRLKLSGGRFRVAELRRRCGTHQNHHAFKIDMIGL